MKVLSEFEWWFFLCVAFVALPLAAVTAAIGLALSRLVPRPPGPVLRGYLIATALECASWCGYTLYKAVTVPWGGH